jgi:hypothetical protein
MCINLEINQGYTTMHGQPVIKNCNLCSFLKLETTFSQLLYIPLIITVSCLCCNVLSLKTRVRISNFE